MMNYNCNFKKVIHKQQLKSNLIFLYIDKQEAAIEIGSSVYSLVYAQQKTWYSWRTWDANLQPRKFVIHYLSNHKQ